MGPRERLQRAHEPGVVAELELRGDLLFDRLEPELLQPRDVPRQRWFPREIGEGGTSPQRERLTQEPVDGPWLAALGAGLVEQVLEAHGVHVVAVGNEDVAGGARLDGVGPDRRTDT